MAGLPPDQACLDAGGLYWLVVASADLADHFGRGVLAAASSERAVLVGLGIAPEPVLDGLVDDAGPRIVTLHHVEARRADAALRALESDLRRLGLASGSLVLVRLPAPLAERLSEAATARLCTRLAALAAAEHLCVLMLADGEGALLVPRLATRHRACSGLARAFAQWGGLHYEVHYWAGATGITARRHYRLLREPGGLRVGAAEDAAEASAEASADMVAADRFMHLVEAEAMEGVAPFSPAWRVSADRGQLMAGALEAHAATVVFTITANLEVDALARLVHQARRERGNALKLVVREMQPCLRYVDERLLMQCGVNLVVPANIPFPRFLTLLETVQGESWRGELDADPEPLIRAHRPPAASGLVGVAQFREIVVDALDRQDQAVESALLSLRPLAGLRIRYVLQQLRMRRQGDLACVYRGNLVLFLFACRRDGIERALAKLFHLAWREMFHGYRLLDGHDVLEMGTATEDEATDGELPEETAGPASTASLPPLAPRPLRLGDPA